MPTVLQYIVIDDGYSVFSVEVVKLNGYLPSVSSLMNEYE